MNGTGADAMETEERKPKKEKVPRQAMPEQDPAVRVRNFEEVPLGFSEETAVTEAKRCIQCKKPGCIAGCPVEVRIPEFIHAIAERRFLEAARILKETNSLPAVCGRVCPQEEQCEQVCILGKKGDPVAIGRLERFAADYERMSGETSVPAPAPSNGKKIAVVGAGPSGLTIAGDLVKLGYEVTVFEGLHKAGGVLVYGIPEFRLPKAIVEAEVDYLQRLGVKIETNAVIGRIATVDDLFAEGFSAVYIAVGAGAPVFMNIPGENLSGIYSANEYLTRSNLMKAYERGQAATPIYDADTVAVLGGGNVAMDAARTALRLGAKKVYVVYRRTRAEMPARAEEVEHAMEEGIEFRFLENAAAILGDERGRVRALTTVRYELGEPDASGRRRPVLIPNSEAELAVGAVIVAIGNGSSPLIPQTTPGLKTDEHGRILVDGDGMTSIDGVYAGGDIVLGAATVILAMGEGRRAAAAINRRLAGA